MGIYPKLLLQTAQKTLIFNVPNAFLLLSELHKRYVTLDISDLCKLYLFVVVVAGDEVVIIMLVFDTLSFACSFPA